MNTEIFPEEGVRHDQGVPAGPRAILRSCYLWSHMLPPVSTFYFDFLFPSLLVTMNAKYYYESKIPDPIGLGPLSGA